MRVVLLACLALAGCGAPGGAMLVSAQSPPGTGATNSASEPQPVGSLPIGAANIAGPASTQPNFFSYTFGSRPAGS